jgi:hypothetical protein
MTQKFFNQDNILTEEVAPGTPMVEISKSMGFTVNLQGYESARIDCSVKISGSLVNVEAIKAEVTKQLEGEVKAAIGQLVEQHDTRKTLLGYSK